MRAQQSNVALFFNYIAGDIGKIKGALIIYFHRLMVGNAKWKLGEEALKAYKFSLVGENRIAPFNKR